MAVSAGGPEAPSVGFPSLHESQGNASPGGGQPGCRPSVTGKSSSGGVEAEPLGGPGGMGEVWESGGRLVCLERVDALSPVVLPGRAIQSVGAGRAGSPLAAGLSAVRVSSTPAAHADIAQDSRRRTHGSAGGTVLAGEDLVPHGPTTPRRDAVASTLEAGSSVSGGGPYLAPSSGPSSAPCLASEGSDLLLSSCDQAVVHTVLNARAPSTRALYANRWRLFCGWCEGQHVDPATCSVPVLLRYLQTLLDRGLQPNTVKVYLAAISARHVPVDGRTLWSHPWVGSFLKGAVRLHPPHVTRVPSWDLPMVLEALCSYPFEPLGQAGLKWLSVKTAFLLAITSAKRVGELHALSVAEECIRWSGDGSGVALWPNPSFLPKRISAFHVNRPVTLAAFVPQPGAEELLLGGRWLCPVRALKQYIATTTDFRKSDALFLCYGGHRKGCAVSKQRLSHWVVDAVLQAYSRRGLPAPPVWCHSTRSVSTSWAALRGVPLADICAAAAWASPCTFARFYRLNVACPPVAAAVLSAASTCD